MTAFRRLMLYTLAGAIAALSAFLLTERPAAGPTDHPCHEDEYHATSPYFPPVCIPADDLLPATTTEAQP